MSICWFKVHDELSDLVSSWVNVLSKEIEEQPITNITSPNNCVNTFSFDPPTTEQQQMCEISEFRGWGLLRNSVSCRGKGSRYCEAQGKGRAKGRLRKVTQRSFIDYRWWISFPWCFTLNLVATTTTFPPLLLLISRIKLIMDQVR